MFRLYDFKCPVCGMVLERLVDNGDVVTCQEHSDVVMRKLPPVFRINMGPVPITGYYDDNLGAFIRSNNHRKQVMEAQGVTERGATPKVVE